MRPSVSSVPTARIAARGGELLNDLSDTLNCLLQLARSSREDVDLIAVPDHLAFAFEYHTVRDAKFRGSNVSVHLATGKHLQAFTRLDIPMDDSADDDGARTDVRTDIRTCLDCQVSGGVDLALETTADADGFPKPHPALEAGVLSQTGYRPM